MSGNRGIGDMKQGAIRIAATDGQAIEVTPDRNADLLVAACLAAAAQGDIAAYYDLGVAYSTGSHGAACDLIEAHKWFNLAALRGNSDAKRYRSELASEMSRAEIGQAQRRAREWLALH